jgi:hypothetical protein
MKEEAIQCRPASGGKGEGKMYSMSEEELDALEKKTIAEAPNNPGGYTGWGWEGRYSPAYVRFDKLEMGPMDNYPHPVRTCPVYPSPGEVGFPCPEQILSSIRCARNEKKGPRRDRVARSNV